MIYVHISREDALSLFPKGGTWCEVGVFSGAFSRTILQRVQPQELHLVDVWKLPWDWDNPPEDEASEIPSFQAWMKQLVPSYDGGHPDPFLQQFYEDMLALAATEKSTTIKVHRGRSHEIAKQLPNAYFDAIYVDADHHYDAVLRDLVCYSDKLKPGGIIMGDDFVEYLRRKGALVGTIDAVNRFVKRTDFQCLALTGPVNSNYLLSRGTTSPYVQEFLKNLVEAPLLVVEINDALLARFVGKTVGTPKGQRVIPSFL